MRYRILQVNDDKIRDVAFRPYDPARYDMANYHETYAGEIANDTDTAALEYLFRKFNIDLPADFKSYSLSVADLVILNDSRVYYCDTAGWKLVQQFVARNDGSPAFPFKH
jgi:hypothetical protein